MNYPFEILPNSNFKLIQCDLTGYSFIRYTSIKDINQLIDPHSNELKQDFVCSPRKQINDMSVSLFGIFNQQHIQIELIDNGDIIYNQYCQPDETVKPPIFQEHFILNLNRGFFFIDFQLMNGQNANYINENASIKISAQSYFEHTPMKWNFWHFSLRWKLDDGRLLHELPEKEKDKLAKKIGTEARALIARNAKFVIEKPMTIIQREYIK